MKWEDFLALLKEHKLSQREFARRNKLNADTVNRWKRRKRGVPHWVPLMFKGKRKKAATPASSAEGARTS